MIKFLHTRIRVSDLEKSIDWYCKNCGFTVLKRNDKSPSGNQIVHLEMPGNAHNLELTYSPDFKVEFPEDLIHTCLGVDDIVEYCQMLEDNGEDVWPGDWKTKFTSGGLKMAFITDPDGYEVEILEN
ncbi:MAG: VOC family protein [Verrucomicrobia bacterium TMED71]|mgnify:FL=1|uniref:VOC family protein n=1 Tax=Candidatus Pelagisphaera phototrophica TaxID=2684113 RepID=UPI000B63A747|nr:VOC family protein [Candidatus Pelagisphaera phototrophica]QXD30563.1 VOC family protein [Candidatus Pelagisphaera phototrophica]RPF77701.1 MAG: VOC family protein [Verrucomicrobia bacterium TMED71]